MKSILEWYKMLPPDIQEEAIFMAKNQRIERFNAINLPEAIMWLCWDGARLTASTMGRPYIQWHLIHRKAELGDYNTPFYSKYLKPVGAKVKTLT